MNFSPMCCRCEQWITNPDLIRPGWREDLHMCLSCYNDAIEQVAEAQHWLEVDKRIAAEEDRSIDGGGGCDMINPTESKKVLKELGVSFPALERTLEQMKEANKEICQNCGIRIEKGTGWCSECLKGLDNDGHDDDAEDNDPIMDELDKDDKAYHERKDDIESDFKEVDE